ncbi:GTP:AMP phosphotransferase, mitochondrial [Saccharomyces cerevisiae]|nr:GTP:AMP phosphotransferase, mitochondrial [Saccharomyces cerevisiae]
MKADAKQITHLLKPLRLLLLGAPGSGDILRQEIKSESTLGREATTYIAQGKLLPDDLITRLITFRLSALGWLKPSAMWLLDGFPRTTAQASALDELLKQHDASLNLVVELDVPESTILERIENRYVHVPSGRVYNLQYNPPKVPGLDDITGEPLTKRLDDTAEVFKKRLEEYKKTNEPLKDYYKKSGIFGTVSGETSDIIFPKLLNLITSKFG